MCITMRKTSTPTATTTTTTTTSSFCFLTRLNHAAGTVRATRFTSRTRTPLFPISPWPAAAPRPASVAMDSHGPPLPDDDVDGPPLHAFMRPGAAGGKRPWGSREGPFFQSQSARGVAGCAATVALPATSPCCRAQCTTMLAESAGVTSARAKFHAMDRSDQQQWIFNHIAQAIRDSEATMDLSTACALPETPAAPRRDLLEHIACSSTGPRATDPSGISWVLAGCRVCFRGWCALLSVGRERVTQIRLAVQKGERPTNWTDQRGFNKGRDPAAHRKVDAFLEFAYQHIAEPMADARVALAADTTEHGMSVA